MIFKTIISITFIVLTAIAGYYCYAQISLEKTNSLNEARYQCAMSSRYTVTNGDTTISYPPEDLYNKCLLEKGVK